MLSAWYWRACVTVQQHSVRTLRELEKREDDDKLADASRAVTELGNACDIFKALHKIVTEGEKTGLDAKSVLVHATFCHDSLNGAHALKEQVSFLTDACTDLKA